MSTMSKDTSDDNTKLAIGELLREADPISKLVIGSYNHVSHYTVNVKSLASAKFKTERLLSTEARLNKHCSWSDGFKWHNAIVVQWFIFVDGFSFDVRSSKLTAGFV